ncbi:MFS transporter [Sphingomonas sp. PP-CC-3G-468]|nr:MFS transporter [Sphingomonas sp. PP-CC-3G-468]
MSSGRRQAGSLASEGSPLIIRGYNTTIVKSRSLRTATVVRILIVQSKHDRGPRGGASIRLQRHTCPITVARLAAGHLPDRFGGARVALWCLGIQAIGLLVIGLAGSGGFAMVGAAIAGAGFSLVFPSLGLEAVRRAPPERRGLAMGTYNAFLDLTLSLGSPVLGCRSGRDRCGLHRRRDRRGPCCSAGTEAAPLSPADGDRR